jgi:hypothetical protein
VYRRTVLRGDNESPHHCANTLFTSRSVSLLAGAGSRKTIGCTAPAFPTALQPSVTPSTLIARYSFI